MIKTTMAGFVIRVFSLCWSCDQQTITPFLVGDNLPTDR
jgi:hypothetical protein